MTLRQPPDQPPKPALHLRVGVIGHRPGKLPGDGAALQARLAGLLAEIQGAARKAGAQVPGDLVTRPPGAPEVTLTLLSSLAEGADRMGAEAALDLGYRLEAPLPFPRDVYEADFSTPESRTAFRDLLSQADSVFEMDGAPTRPGPAYDAAARVLVNRCDLLVALWDGEDPAGQGGTGGTVALALDEGVPILHVPLDAKHSIDLLWTGGEIVPAAEVSRDSHRTPLEDGALDRLAEALLVPSPATVAGLRAYLSDRRRRVPLACLHALMMFVFTGKRFGKDTLFPQPFLNSARRNWGLGGEGKETPESGYFARLRPGRVRDAIEGMLVPAFAAADGLAVIHSNLYRSAFVFNFVAAAVAVTLALMGLVFPEAKFYLITAECGIIGSILWVTLLGKRRQWHRHWLEDRELAERLRHLRVQILVGASGGATRPLAPEQIPNRDAASGEPDWITWLLRATARSLPLPHVCADGDYLERVSQILREEEITAQIAYHRANHARSHRLEHGLHRLGAVLFFSTLGICALFALLYFPVLHHLDHPDRSSDAYDVIAKIVTIVTALFPAFGAAFAGIHAQSDLGTLVRRSWETKTRLERLAASMDGQKTHSLAALSGRVTLASDILVSDLDSWRTIFVARPLVLPS
ncbi:hypothetical protein [Rhodospirillum sp. A1_3_36]|uniref:hypothetical protein n=1 Tax=Rhodospirillum sp. A1_3_36 TaxID=3391666 RepID=UPI0039A5488D